jgi:hypothetical protein
MRSWATFALESHSAVSYWSSKICYIDRKNGLGVSYRLYLGPHIPKVGIVETEIHITIKE